MNIISPTIRLNNLICSACQLDLGRKYAGFITVFATNTTPTESIVNNACRIIATLSISDVTGTTLLYPCWKPFRNYPRKFGCRLPRKDPPPRNLVKWNENSVKYQSTGLDQHSTASLAKRPEEEFHQWRWRDYGVGNWRLGDRWGSSVATMQTD